MPIVAPPSPCALIAPVTLVYGLHDRAAGEDAARAAVRVAIALAPRVAFTVIAVPGLWMFVCVPRNASSTDSESSPTVAVAIAKAAPKPSEMETTKRCASVFASCRSAR